METPISYNEDTIGTSGDYVMGIHGSCKFFIVFHSTFHQKLVKVPSQNGYYISQFSFYLEGIDIGGLWDLIYNNEYWFMGIPGDSLKRISLGGSKWPIRSWSHHVSFHWSFFQNLNRICVVELAISFRNTLQAPIFSPQPMPPSPPSQQLGWADAPGAFDERLHARNSQRAPAEARRDRMSWGCEPRWLHELENDGEWWWVGREFYCQLSW